MSISRRHFLAALAGAFGIAQDPERLLWTPGAKLISIPKPLPLKSELRITGLYYFNSDVAFTPILQTTLAAFLMGNDRWTTSTTHSP